jgi:DNA invertase Pin-like site-specific DNA recombinase
MAETERENIRESTLEGLDTVARKGKHGGLSAGQQAVNRSHAKIRALVEQAMTTLKTWRLLRKLRCSTNRITSLAQAVLTLHQASSCAG